jgi:small-conductance mechanosensitive channel
MENVDFDAMWNTFLLRILPLLAAFGIAAIISLLSRRFVRRVFSVSRFVPQHRRLAEQRQQTVQGVLVGLISFGAFTAATFFCIAQFVDLSTLVWVLGLFSAAFGLGFRPLISDYLTGIMFIFEDTFDVGEKVEIVGVYPVEGIVEEVRFRVIHLRGTSGELYVIPNGEIRMIRNFSRGKFSPANVTLKIAAKDLKKTLGVLETLNQDAMTLLPNLIEPWHVISEESSVGQNAELTILAKARFGTAAEMRPHLVALLHQYISEAGIEFAT